MDLLRTLAATLSVVLIVGCAQSFTPSTKSPTPVPQQIISDKPFLDGEFKLEDGTSLRLSDLNSQPYLIFFVSETCSSCRAETSEFLTHFQAHGKPTQISFVSVLIGSFPEDISDWKNSFSHGPVDWTVGSDADLRLYRHYFREIKTPSILFFDPTSRVVKRWQERQSLEFLKKETAPWY